MAGSIRDKQKKVREQGYAAARKGTLYPRELQNVPGDWWEDAKVYNKNTRQGQNYWQDHMKIDPRKQTESSEEQRRRQKRNAIADRLLLKNYAAALKRREK